MKKILFFFLLTGCVSEPVDPISTSPTDNREIYYQVLFTRNGCEIGRFKDKRWVYVTLCPGGFSSSQTHHIESCGKNCNQEIDDFQTQITSKNTDIGINYGNK